MPVLAGAEPFSHTGSTEVGVLLCHGFTGDTGEHASVG